MVGSLMGGITFISAWVFSDLSIATRVAVSFFAIGFFSTWIGDGLDGISRLFRRTGTEK